jgi:hypothetical protein
VGDCDKGRAKATAAMAGSTALPTISVIVCGRPCVMYRDGAYKPSWIWKPLPRERLVQMALTLVQAWFKESQSA